MGATQKRSSRIAGAAESRESLVRATNKKKEEKPSREYSIPEEIEQSSYGGTNSVEKRVSHLSSGNSHEVREGEEEGSK